MNRLETQAFEGEEDASLADIAEWMKEDVTS